MKYTSRVMSFRAILGMMALLVGATAQPCLARAQSVPVTQATAIPGVRPDTSPELRILRQDQDVQTGFGASMGVSVYYQETQVRKPTIYFCAGGSLDRREYEHLSRFLVRQGYVVVAASYYGFTPWHITDNCFEAFVQGWLMCQGLGINDDTRVGLAGHSSGAGILPSLGYRFFVEQGMGTAGRFIYGATPWVDFQYQNNRELPADTRFVTSWFENDHGTVRGIYRPLADLARFTFTGVGEATIFPAQDVETEYLHIRANGTLPSDADYAVMVAGTAALGDPFPCDTGPVYEPNPRQVECCGYRNKMDWFPPSQSFGGVPTDSLAPYPAYLQPELGTVFKNKIVRVTDEPTVHVNHPYPKTPSWNVDGSLLLLTNTLLDGETYEVIRDDMSWSDSERKWSSLDPYVYFAMQPHIDRTGDGVDDFSFVKRDVHITLANGTRPTTEVLITFSGAEYEEVTIGSYEGNIDRLDEHLVFSGKRHGQNDVVAMVYHIPSRQVLTSLSLPGIRWYDLPANPGNRIFDWISISPLGDQILVNFVEDPTNPDPDIRGAIYQYDRQLNFVRKLADHANHGDLGVDAHGDQVYAQFGFGSLRGIWSYRLSDGAVVQLLPDKYNGGHLSCRNIQRDGWCYLSTVQETHREVFALKLDGSGTVQRFAQTHTIGTNNSLGGVSPDGSKMLFQSTWHSASQGGRRETFVVEGL